MRLLISLLSLIAPLAAGAASFQIGTGAGYPGSTVTVQLSFTGDGTTSGAEVAAYIDSARLYFDAQPGAIPGASVGGSCSWNGASRIGALVYSGSTAPLPSGQTVLCELPIAVRDNARPGRSAIRLGSQLCSGSNLLPQPCTVINGWVDVLGTTSLGGMPAQEETNELSFLLTPQADEQLSSALLDWENGQKALPTELGAFRNFPPRSIRRLATPAVGDHAARLRRERDSLDARMQRYFLAEFDSPGLRDQALQRLRQEHLIVSAHAAEPIRFSAGGAARASGAASKSATADVQEHLGVLNMQGAWDRAEGWSLIGVLDSGIAPDHPELRSRTGPHSTSGALVPGGNFLPYFSRNQGAFQQDEDNLDEVQRSYAGSTALDCDPNGGGWLTPELAGHGTHAAGLAAANGLDGTGVRGTCTKCGLAIRRITYASCGQKQNTDPPEYLAFPRLISDVAQAPVLSDAIRAGVQVASLSFGRSALYCPQGHVYCTAVDLATQQDVLVVAASGNSRTTLQFPAMVRSVVAVGGSFLDGFTFWDDAPGNDLQGCPYPGVSAECGSNFSTSTRKQEVIAPAKAIYSIAYPGHDWNVDISCGDSYGSGTGSDGAGLCTGTSMSTPQVAGLFGLLRSINPMVRRGEPFQLGAYGLRNVVAETASRGIAAHDDKEGFGVPDAQAAAERMLGTVREEVVRNRLAPLFAAYSPGADDYAAVASPQLAMALALYQADAYYSVPSGPIDFVAGYTVPGYPAFPNTVAGAPRARALILTTPHKMRSEHPNLVPLHLLEKPGPAAQRDFILLSSETVVNTAMSAGYQYAGRQGYVYAACSPYPACRPQGTSRLHLRCRIGGDCAVFLDEQTKAFDGRGYTQLFPGMGNSVLGLAYPATDSDGDGLPNVFEFLIGSHYLSADSDGDGTPDGVEYPFAGVPQSDPCHGGPSQCPGLDAYLFRDSFE